MAKRRVTISDVARLAGVSRTAVSFAFNKPEQLSTETAERILEAARQLGYAPNPHARALHSNRVGVIGVLVPQSLNAIFGNLFFPAFLQGVGTVCDHHSLGLLVVSPLEGSLERAIVRAPVDGFIIVGLNEQHKEVSPLRKRKMPFVIVDGEAESASSVNGTDEAGAYAAASHLLTGGHKDLLILTFETPLEHLDHVHYGVGGWRMHGYQRAFDDRQIPWNPERLIPTLTSIDGGYEAFIQQWQAGVRPTALLTMSDVMAIGALQAAAELGVEVPNDLEVIGFDDVPLAKLISPSLSTVRQPIYEKGRLATELLVAAMERNTAADHRLLKADLILRGTTRGTAHR